MNLRTIGILTVAIWVSAATAHAFDGTQWHTYGPTACGTIGQNALVVDPNNQSRILAGSDSGGNTCPSGTASGLFTSTDGGLSWSQITGSLPNPIIGTRYSAVSVNTSGVHNLIYTNFAPGTGVQYTSNGGISWQLGAFFNSKHVTALAVRSDDSVVVGANGSDGQLFLSSSDFSSNQQINSDLPAGNTQFIQLGGGSPNTFYVGIFDGGVYYTTTSGASYTAMNAGLSGATLKVKAMAISGSELFILVQATSGDSRIMHWSGSAWVDFGSGLPATGTANGVALRQKACGVDVFVGMDGAGVYRRQSFETSFSAYNPSLTDTIMGGLTFTTGSSTNLLAASKTSLNSGKVWGITPAIACP